MFGYLCDSEVLLCFQIALIPGGYRPTLGVKWKKISTLAIARHDPCHRTLIFTLVYCGFISETGELVSILSCRSKRVKQSRMIIRSWERERERERERETFLGCLVAVFDWYRLNVVGKLAATLLLVYSPDGVTKHILSELRHRSTFKTLVEQTTCNGQSSASYIMMPTMFK